MKERIITTQKQLDKLVEVKSGESVTIDAELRLGQIVKVYGSLTINKKVDCNWYDNRYFEAWGSATVRAWGSATVRASGSATVRAWGSATVEASGSATVRASGSATVRAWGSATVRAWGSATVRAWGSATVRAWGSATVRAWGSATVEASGSATVRGISDGIKVTLLAFAVCFQMPGHKFSIKASKTATVIKPKYASNADEWLENHGIDATKKVVLYKRVSQDWKTQENTANETIWEPGMTLEHPSWGPEQAECGPGKFHACDRPWRCDEFRSNRNDRYIAIEINKADLYVWPSNPSYPHKIAFRKGTVLHEVDSFGVKI
jgi:hypothetical protein